MTILLLLSHLAFADKNVTTFITDPNYTGAPFAGMESLYVDPTTTQAQLKPLADRPTGEKVADVPGKGTLEFTNPMSYFGDVTVNGVKIGTLGPYATFHFSGMAPGWYSITMAMPNGFSRTFAQQVQ